MKKEKIIYRLPVRSVKEIKHAERRQWEAYKHYNNVVVINDGLDYIKIVCY